MSTYELLSGTRRHRALVALAAVGIASVVTSSINASPAAAAAAAVPRFTLGAAAVDLPSGGTASLPIVFDSNRVGTLRWSMSGLPAGVNASIKCVTGRRCDVTLQAATNAPDARTNVAVVFTSATARRSTTFALAVHGQAPPPPPPAPAPTTPPTTPPTVPVAVAPQTFVLRPGNLIATGLPAGDVAFPLFIDRAGWVGTVALTVETKPSGWNAAFLPVNPVLNASSTLVLSIPAGTPNSDYPVRIRATSATMTVDATLVVRVRFGQLSLTVTSAPSLSTSGSGQFVVDVRSVDEPTRAVALSVEGLPAGVSVVYSSNPAIGPVAVNFSATPAVPAGSYPITFVASRDDLVLRVASVLVVPVRVVFTFTPTAVAGTGTPGYLLSSTPGAVTLQRGAAAAFDITVTPVGGFVSPIDVSLGVPVGWGVAYGTLGANQFRITVSAPSSAALGTVSLPLYTSSGALAASLTLAATVTA
jgi:hypothetical protein